MPTSTPDPASLLRRGLESGRVHSAYLLAGSDESPREAALRFARGLVCTGPAPERPCEACRACRLSGAPSEITLDGSGRKGPLYRHVGDHPDLLWVERGPDDTRVRIGQIRALQAALQLRAHAGGRRVAVVADAERLNQEAQNAILRLLEEPPPETTLVLVTRSAAALLATVRSRCQRLIFPPPPEPDPRAPDAPEEVRELVGQLDRIGTLRDPELLDWAEQYRGERATAAAAAESLLAAASRWLRERVREHASAPDARLRRELDAFAELQRCRRALVQRNANPQMIAERALLVLHDAVQP